MTLSNTIERELSANKSEIVRTMNAIMLPGQVTELRALNAKLRGDRFTGTVSGYFDDWDKLAAAAATIIDASGIYFIPNPCDPALIARANNRVKMCGAKQSGNSTADHDITQRNWLLIDCDPVRPAGISSSDAEHDLAIERASKIATWLSSKGWSGEILGDSGNGAHLLYRIDLPRDDDGRVQRILQALDREHSDNGVKVDTSCFNQARIWKLYGTPVRKGDSTPERPHRMASLIFAPAEATTVDTALLDELATPSKPITNGFTAHRDRYRFDQDGDPKPIDLEKLLRNSGMKMTGPTDWRSQSGFAKKWVFDTCPWNSDHTNGSAWAAHFDSGAVAAGCHHNGCQGRGWDDLRPIIDPDFRTRQNGRAVGKNGHHVARVSVLAEPAKSVIAEPWSDPLELPNGLPPVLPFDLNLLPKAFRVWAADISERMQCPPDFIAVTVMIAAGALIGRKCAIRPKRCDSWQVVPNLWGGPVGRPSLMKTHAVSEALKPIKRLEIDAKKEYEEEKQEYEAAKMLADAQRKAKTAELKSKVKDGGDGSALATELATMTANDQPPTRRRYLTNDPTVEKLGELMRENPNGLLLYSDELITLLRSMEKSGHESDRGFYLTAWNGSERHTVDRLGRGTVDVEAAVVSVVGGIQPGVLASYLRGAVAGGAEDDGFVQRFQLLVWPDAPKAWRNVDRYPNLDAKNSAYEAFRKLDKLTPDQVLAHKDDLDKDALPFLQFDEPAQELFNDWRFRHEHRTAGSEHSTMEAHLAKFRSLIPSLALIYHLADGNAGPVSVAAIAAAIAWGEYLESHARRIYSSVTEMGALAARELARRILAGDVEDQFTARDIYRRHWQALDREATDAAIDTLISLNWIEEREEPTAGRPKVRYAINPKILSKRQDLKVPKGSKGTSGTFGTSESGDVPDFSDDDYERLEREAIQSEEM